MLITLFSRKVCVLSDKWGVLSNGGEGVLAWGIWKISRADWIWLVKGAKGWWRRKVLVVLVVLVVVAVWFMLLRPKVMAPTLLRRRCLYLWFRVCMACGSGWPFNSNHTAADGSMRARNRTRREMGLQGPHNEGYPPVGSRVLR
jgi:hypothetical protein